MEKIILVDGNNLIFRSYYATAATGNLMVNSKNYPTNALYGFTNMINKIIEEEKPTFMAVAYDIGKNFRHDKYKEYKAGRSATPNELIIQLNKSKELLDAMGIKHIELENYEADDIIGTLSKMALDDKDFIATIVSSDKDLLQLINEEVEVKLLKSKDYIRYTKEKFIEDYGIDPIKMIDLKALMGDSSDNVPGVKGIGEKTALKLLQQYNSLEGIYNSIDTIKGATHDKLITDKDTAFFCKDICTICLNAPIKENLTDCKYLGPNNNKLIEIYKELEFYSLLKKMDFKQENTKSNYKILNNVKEINKDNKISYYIECDNENYHDAKLLGMGLYDGKNLFYVKPEMINECLDYLKDTEKYTYDLKKNINLLNNINLNTSFDLMIAAYLLNYQIKEDLAVLMNKEEIYIPFYNEVIKSKTHENEVTLKAKYIFDNKDRFINELAKEEMLDLFTKVEMPLITILAKMEMNGIICDKNILDSLQKDMDKNLDDIAKKIYAVCGEEFNINSPTQLGIILFEHMNLPFTHKNAKSKRYNTDASTILKLSKKIPELKLIIDYRNLVKLNSTYLEGLKDYIREDGKIHTIYKQALTRTGRLSSLDPNMQNIPSKKEDGKLVKKAFLPEYDSFLSTDYSQIELRVLAHLSGSKELINAFNNNIDIHKQVASDIFGVPLEEVTTLQRSKAKAVVFGIVYGISSFGLSENLQIRPTEAKELIEKFNEMYPGVKEYMDNVVRDAYSNGYVRTLFNRKRNIEELTNKNYMIRQAGERIAMNTPIQGTSADILKMAMIKIDEEMTKNNLKSKLLLQVHDELIFDCVDSEKEELTKIVKDAMENTVKLDVALKASLDFGPTWYDTK